MAEVLQSDFSLLGLEEELTCSICLSTFQCPVTIPCGHNFCQDCLLATWRDTYSCPQCRTHFPTKPELKKNTVLSTVVETFNLRSSKSEMSRMKEEKKVIRCDTCMEAEAAQTCLTCMASFCEEHLRPHRENPNFAVHQLSDLVSDLSERICPDHHKLMELFCSEHGRPICSLCLQQVHKGCSFTSPEEQRSLKESELRDKLGVLDAKIEKTETVMFQMSDMQSKLMEGATKRKAALATMYQQMQDLFAQEEREAQNEVDRELETAQMKLQELLKKLTDNVMQMRKARDDIDSLMSRSQTSAFLQASFDLPRVVKFEPHIPRINLDSKKVTATQAFAAALKEHLMETFQHPVEARLQIIKQEPVSGPASTESAGAQPESEPQEPPELKNPPRSHSPGPRHIQPFFQPVPVPVFSYFGQQPSWKSSQYTCHKPAHFKSAQPPKAGPTYEKSASSHQQPHSKKSDSHQPHHKKDQKKPGAHGGNQPGTPRSDFTKRGQGKSHPSDQSKHRPQPKKN
ncbi:E3 ubiquitin/ISG15 ligase TRIM25-like [Echeneis naucrates]|uniref:E3 ubiquitin/ISG15 ligase TRIM25-like n=1 Tax=Echeneis naucrates TaxID=173247 RepID=UPI0011142F54|nr:E3 ubiquitin/ISG15 ligase TRIM25-like [Echeneis naucrates]